MSGVNFNQSAAMTNLTNREQRQDARIQQGIQSGQLTPKEATRLQSRELRIDNRIQRQESQPGGLTQAEFMRDTFRMDKASFSIWSQKHDAQHVTPQPTPSTDPSQGATPTPGTDPSQGTDPTQGVGSTPSASATDPVAALQAMVGQIQALVQQLLSSSSATT